MPENRGVRAPYNFVPFSGRVLLPYTGVDELPRHDEICGDLKSGEIQVTMRAETPVFVSNGNKDDPHFFKGADGRFKIPGSTVRGMTRENMQILGFGVIRPGEDLEDYQIYFREMAAARGSVGGPLKEYYCSALDIQSRRNPKTGKNITIPQRVSSGYLACRNGIYVIRPTKGPVLLVSRAMEDVQRFGTDPARVVPVVYQAADGVVKQILPAEAGKPGMASGMLLYTGRPVGKPNHLYLFPEADPDAPEVPVRPKDILSYRADLENRSKSLGAYYPVSFWELPEEGEEKPVFFVQFEEHLYFGMSRFLRIGYRYPLSEGLPKRHREMMRQENVPLDYPHAILGFAAKQDSSQKDSYRSRVSFGDFTAVGDPKEQGEVRMVLGGPKPSYYPGYVVDGRNYNDIPQGAEKDSDRFQLRGYKQYWLKDVQATSVQEGKERVGTAFRPLPAGTEFRGTIQFRNLTELELGLLLWSLRLEDGCFQTVGKGKPYGYGRMRLQISALRILDPARLYCGDLTADPWTDVSGQVAAYIDRYNSSALGTSGKKKKLLHVRDRQEIQDFFFIKRILRAPAEVSYMDLSEYQNVRAPLPVIRDVREAAEKAPQSDGGTGSSDPEDIYEALRNKFKKL